MAGTFFAPGLAGRPFEGSCGVRRRRPLLGLALPAAVSPRIHSTVRFGKRSQAHMGDSGALSFLSLSLHLPGPRSSGSCRARGPASYGDSRSPRVHAEGLGLSRPPGSAAAAGALFQPGGAPHGASRTWPSRRVGLGFREISGVGGQFVCLGPAADAGATGLEVRPAMEFAGDGAVGTGRFGGEKFGGQSDGRG